MVPPGKVFLQAMFTDFDPSAHNNRFSYKPVSPQIRNSSDLISRGNRRLRKQAVSIIEYALKESHPYNAAAQQIDERGGILKIGESINLDLDKFKSIVVVGAGKATFGVASYLDELLSDRVSHGLVISKDSEQKELDRIKVVVGGHPLPNVQGYNAAQGILALCNSLTQDTLVISLFTGGSSALLTAPASGISLDEMRTATRILLSCGASITEVNAVRKHISMVKGGLLGRRIAPATLVNITVSDVVGDEWDYITDPTVPDTSTFEDALKVLGKYSLREELPCSIVRHLERQESETPKSYSHPYFNHLLLNSYAACSAAQTKAVQHGFAVEGYENNLVGDVSALAGSFSERVIEIAEKVRPYGFPVSVIVGGEKTVACREEDFGRGGPNQEFALLCSDIIKGRKDILICSIDTDGTDGPTEYAGAMVDGETVDSFGKNGLDLHHFLKHHQSSVALSKSKDFIETGHTGTNVNDLTIALIDPREG